MAQRGGSIRELSINNRIFAVAADATANVFLGGDVLEVEANGDGSDRALSTPTPARIEGLAVAIDHRNGDHEFLQDTANRGERVPVVITYADRSRFGANMRLVEEPVLDTSKATCTVALKGGRLRQQT